MSVLRLLVHEFEFEEISLSQRTQLIKHILTPPDLKDEGFYKYTLVIPSQRWRANAKIQIEPRWKTSTSDRREPDLVLTLECQQKQERTRVLVFDAKFKKYWESLPETTQQVRRKRHLNSLEAELSLMAFGLDHNRFYLPTWAPNINESKWRSLARDYSCSGTFPVFILHPCRNVYKDTSQPEWKRSTSYGGRKKFAWEERLLGTEKEPNHSFGAISLRPSNISDLKRFLAAQLFILKYSQSTPHNSMKICVVCGHEMSYKKPTTRASAWFICKECNPNDERATTVVNRCFNCGTKLFKLGTGSIHETHPTHPYNIRCPSCGLYAHFRAPSR